MVIKLFIIFILQDNILDESWEEFDNEYHMTVEGCDRDGHPIVAFRVGEWGKDFFKFIKKLVK